MIHRLALIVGSVAAAAILGLGFAATGFGPRAAPVDAEQPSAGTVASAQTGLAKPDPITKVETTKVYVRPAAKPKVIHVTRQASAPARQHTVKVVRAPKVRGGGGDDGGSERGDD